jgi:hypothetical protein
MFASAFPWPRLNKRAFWTAMGKALECLGTALLTFWSPSAWSKGVRDAVRALRGAPTKNMAHEHFAMFFKVHVLLAVLVTLSAVAHGLGHSIVAGQVPLALPGIGFWIIDILIRLTFTNCAPRSQLSPCLLGVLLLWLCAVEMVQLLHLSWLRCVRQPAHNCRCHSYALRTWPSMMWPWSLVAFDIRRKDIRRIRRLATDYFSSVP